MGILASFKENESRRINEFFDIVETFPNEEINRLIDEIFAGFIARGAIGQTVLNVLKQKIARACNLPVTDLDTKDLHALELGKKHALVVTICNDICALGVVQEASVKNFLAECLRKEPGGSDSGTPSRKKSRQ